MLADAKSLLLSMKKAQDDDAKQSKAQSVAAAKAQNTYHGKMAESASQLELAVQNGAVFMEKCTAAAEKLSAATESAATALQAMTTAESQRSQLYPRDRDGAFRQERPIATAQGQGSPRDQRGAKRQRDHDRANASPGGEGNFGDAQFQQLYRDGDRRGTAGGRGDRATTRYYADDDGYGQAGRVRGRVYTDY